MLSYRFIHLTTQIITDRCYNSSSLHEMGSAISRGNATNANGNVVKQSPESSNNLSNHRLPQIKLSHSIPRPAESNTKHVDQTHDILTMTQVLATSSTISSPHKSMSLEESKESSDTSITPSEPKLSLTPPQSNDRISSAAILQPAQSQGDNSTRQLKKKISLPPVDPTSLKSVQSNATLARQAARKSLDDPYVMPAGVVKNGQPAQMPDNEDERVKALLSYGVLDTLPEEGFDSLARLAAEICETPIALISFVDSDRQWFKARVGLDAPETSRDLAFCSHAILDAKNVFVVPDSTKDPRFADNALVKSAPYGS